MRLPKNLALILAPALLAFAAADGPFRVEPEEGCVVASRLVGAWTPDAAVSGSLGTKPRFERITFTESADVAKRIPAKYEEFLGDRQIYLAGSLELRRGEEITRYPFILVDFSGNQNVLVFRERDGDPMGDGESFIVTLAPAKDGANDLLFMGGDFNNEPFKAYRRASDAE